MSDWTPTDDDRAFTPGQAAACWTPGGTLNPWFFPERVEGQDNHGAKAKAICATCPARASCLLAALARNEENGIWGGAGEQRRRTLRRALAEGPARFAEVIAAHWRNLDGVADPGDHELLAAYGAGATHGSASTYAKGCTCDACALAAATRTAAAKFRPRRKPDTTKETTDG